MAGRWGRHEVRVDTVPTLDAGQYAGDIAMHADVGGLLVSMTRYARDLPVPGAHCHVNARIRLSNEYRPWEEDKPLRYADDLPERNDD